MNNRAFAVLMSGLVLSTSVCADEDVPVRLDPALNYALANRLELKQETLAVAGAEAGIREQQGLFLPTLDAKAGLYRQQTNDHFTGIEISGEVNGAPVSVQVDRTLPRYQGTTGLEAKWNLYSGGARKAQVEQAKAGRDKAEAERRKTRRLVALDAASGLIRWRQARIRQTLAEKELAVVRKTLQITRVQHTASAQSDIELQRAELDQTRAEIGLQKAGRKQAQSWRDYLTAINHPFVPPPDRFEQELGDVQATLDTLFPSSDDPDVRIAQSEMHEARQKLEQSKAAFRPEVNLLMRYNTFDRSDRNLSEAMDSLAASEKMIGLQMNWNLYSGQRDRYRKEQAAIRQEQAKNKVLLARMNERDRKQELANRLQTSRDELRLARQEAKLQIAMHALDVTRFKHGDLSELANMQAELKLAQADMEQKSRELDFALAEIQYRLEISGE